MQRCFPLIDGHVPRVTARGSVARSAGSFEAMRGFFPLIHDHVPRVTSSCRHRQSPLEAVAGSALVVADHGDESSGAVLSLSPSFPRRDSNRVAGTPPRRRPPPAWRPARGARPKSPQRSEESRPGGSTPPVRHPPPRPPCAPTKIPDHCAAGEGDGGQGGIRTPERVSPLRAFQARAFSRSATCPGHMREAPGLWPGWGGGQGGSHAKRALGHG